MPPPPQATPQTLQSSPRAAPAIIARDPLPASRLARHRNLKACEPTGEYPPPNHQNAIFDAIRNTGTHALLNSARHVHLGLLSELTYALAPSNTCYTCLCYCIHVQPHHNPPKKYAKAARHVIALSTLFLNETPMAPKPWESVRNCFEVVSESRQKPNID